MKIIITGGSGLIGSDLAKLLMENGHSVIILTRKSGRRVDPGGQLQWVKWDGMTTNGWGYLVDGADAIVNLAGSNISAGRWTERRKQEILESRVSAGKAVAQAVQDAKKKPGVLIQSSGVGAYGISLTGQFDETSPMGNDYLAGVCREWESSTQSVEKLGVRRVIIRNGVVLSRKGGVLPRMLLPFMFFIGGPFGSGRQWVPWIHWKDEARAIYFLMQNPKAEGIINLTAEPVTNQTLIREIGKVMRRPSFFTIPAFAIRLLFGEMGTMVLDGQYPVNQKLSALGFQFEFGNIKNALRDLLLKED